MERSSDKNLILVVAGALVAFLGLLIYRTRPQRQMAMTGYGEMPLDILLADRASIHMMSNEEIGAFLGSEDGIFPFELDDQGVIFTGLPGSGDIEQDNGQSRCCHCRTPYPDPTGTHEIDIAAQMKWSMISFGDGRPCLLACSDLCLEIHMVQGHADHE